MRIKVYHDVNGTVRITKTIEQGSDMGKESSIFSDLKKYPLISSSTSSLNPGRSDTITGV